MPQTLTLHHYWRSSCSWRVRWALALKGVPYQSVPVNILKGEHRDPAYMALNPAGFLPCLEIDGEPYGESLALIEWIEETWPTPALLPQDPLSRLYVRQLALTIAAGTQPLQNPFALKYYKLDDQERTKAARHWIERGLGTYETLLRKGRPGTYSFGGEVTVADLCLVPQVYNALRFQVDMSQFPLIEGIYERCLKTKECDAAAPHNQPGAQP
jgi:maleylacetoacetate isomerase/maleylpyruvate isomerase